MSSQTDLRAPRKRGYHAQSAAWYLSSGAVSLAVTEVAHWTPLKCVRFLARARWGEAETFSCPHCETVAKHYWRPKELRWKCRGCDKTFSVTSGTVFANRRIALPKLLAAILTWVNSVGGQPALELRRHLKLGYRAAFTLQHKLREALVRGFNVGTLAGDVEMDGSHRSGWRAAHKRGKPQVSTPKDAQEEQQNIDAAAQAAVAAIQAANEGRHPPRKPRKHGAVDPEFGQRLDKDRRILVAVRLRAGAKGKGACATRVAVGKAEDSPVAQAITEAFIAVPESMLNTDTSPAYVKLGAAFRAHRTVEHARMLVGPNGENNNQAEEFGARMKRMEKGTYLNIEKKYVLDYGVEGAFRSDTCRLSNGHRMRVALHAQLAGDIRRYERLMAELADALAQARSTLAALQVTLREFDQGIDPAAMPPRNAWAGKYGQRGALKQAVLKLLQEAAPEAVTTTEMGLRLAARFGLHFATSADFRTWVDNTLLPQLKRCARQGAIERLHNP